MNDQLDNAGDNKLEVLRELEEEDAWIDGDVLQVGEDAWAIHGVIPYGGEVEIAAFATYGEAKQALDGVGEAAGPARDG